MFEHIVLKLFWFGLARIKRKLTALVEQSICLSWLPNLMRKLGTSGKTHARNHINLGACHV